MTTKMPKYMIAKIERMNDLICEAQTLNEELETWIEDNADVDGFDFTFDYRDSTAYAIFDVNAFVRHVNEELSTRN